MALSRTYLTDPTSTIFFGTQKKNLSSQTEGHRAERCNWYGCSDFTILHLSTSFYFLCQHSWQRQICSLERPTFFCPQPFYNWSIHWRTSWWILLPLLQFILPQHLPTSKFGNQVWSLLQHSQIRWFWQHFLSSFQILPWYLHKKDSLLYPWWKFHSQLIDNLQVQHFGFYLLHIVSAEILVPVTNTHVLSLL